jgi:hypothetical protein
MEVWAVSRVGVRMRLGFHVHRKDVVRDEDGTCLYGEAHSMMKNFVMLKLWARFVMLSLGPTL